MFNVVAELLVTLKGDRDVIVSIILQLSNSIMKLIQIKMEMEIDATDNNGNTCCFVKFFSLTGRVTRLKKILYYVFIIYLCDS